MTPNEFVLFRFQVAELLLLYGANVNAKDANGRAPIHACASNGHVGCVELLLKHRVNVNLQDSRGNTPLHNASKWADVDVVRALLRGGANVNIKNAAGLTPIEVGAAKGRDEALLTFFSLLVTVQETSHPQVLKRLNAAATGAPADLPSEFWLVGASGEMAHLCGHYLQVSEAL